MGVLSRVHPCINSKYIKSTSKVHQKYIKSTPLHRFVPGVNFRVSIFPLESTSGYRFGIDSKYIESTPLHHFFPGVNFRVSISPWSQPRGIDLVSIPSTSKVPPCIVFPPESTSGYRFKVHSYINPKYLKSTPKHPPLHQLSPGVDASVSTSPHRQ